MVPVVLFASFLYSSYIWKLAPIPSASYPFAQVMWRLRALQTCIWFTGTLKSEMTVAADRDKATWEPSNLVEGEWWYWRVRAVEQEWVESDGARGEAGPWSETRAFYTYFGDGAPQEVPAMPPGALSGAGMSLRGLPAAAFLDTGPEEGEGIEVRPLGPPTRPLTGAEGLIRDAVTDTSRLRVLLSGPTPAIGLATSPRPALSAEAETALPDGWLYYFAVDTDPNFSSPWIQRSTDEPWLFRAIKPNIIAAGTVVGLGSYILLSAFGLPVLLVFGYVRALTTIPHWMVTEVIGAMLARYYFNRKYGTKQWRTYAPVLAVGFACGMALMGMASISVALIQKSVSVLIF